MCLEILLQNSFHKNLISKNVDTEDRLKNRINRDQGITTLNSQIVQFYEQKREFFLFRLYYIVIIMVVFWKQVVHARFYLLFTTQHFIFIRRVGDKSWEDRLVMIQPSHHIFSSLGVYWPKSSALLDVQQRIFYQTSSRNFLLDVQQQKNSYLLGVFQKE